MSEHEAHYILEGGRRYLFCDTVSNCAIHPTQNIDQLWRDKTILLEENESLRIRVGIAESTAEGYLRRLDKLQAVVEAVDAMYVELDNGRGGMKEEEVLLKALEALEDE